MTVGDWARLLYIIGGAFAIAGPAIAAVRTARAYGRAKEFQGTWDDFDAAWSAETVHSTARADAWWGVIEFALVGVGVALASVASLLLIPS
ncbi:hypothetical protein [Microbacterium sp. SMR1]|uniref:hypothetical protein n=1 Tax=Microbacterium sp. SMR1 TaxID=1497340 RepID=UPI0011BE9D05|nr:hypothetical protein [Microbacterium sp. SMR1]